MLEEVQSTVLLRCPSCQGIIQPTDLCCMICGKGAEEALSSFFEGALTQGQPRQRHVEVTMEFALAALTRAQVEGINTAKIDLVLERARAEQDHGNYDFAFRFASEAYREITETIRTHESVMARFQGLLAALERFPNSSANFREARWFADMAEVSILTGDYSEALGHLCKGASILARKPSIPLTR